MSPAPESPNKRLKTQVLEDSNRRVDLQHSSEDNQPDSCGICYADHGTSIRGEIDCCNHFFCFVCIMEWSKHESRCPLCRQRFSTVCRPPKPGVFPSSRLVKVPLRDQVYHVHGNLRTGPVDPYVGTRCSVCNSEEDESFLLLCDLCDTASHTYCVGLGYIVPEGDWFCHDCAVSGAIENNDVDRQCDLPIAEPSLAILDIVREPDGQRVSRLRPSPHFTPLRDKMNRNKDKNHDISARTLRRCRNVQSNIQALRENWNALRNGSLTFSSSSCESGVKHGQRKNSDSLAHGKLVPPHSLASTGLQQSTVQSSPSGDKLNERGSEDVNKAWKMLDRAKAMQKSNQMNRILPLGVYHPSRGAGPRKASSVRCNDQELRIQQSSRLTGKEKQYNYSGFNKDVDNYWPTKLGKQNQGRVTQKEIIQYTRDLASQLEGCSERSLSIEVHNSIQGASPHENAERNFAKLSRSTRLVTSIAVAPSDGEFGRVSSSSKEMDKKKWLAKSFGDANTGECEDAKNEIKSLVKLNLKVLSKDKQLGVDAFKEIARQSTHTILGACSAEHEKSDRSSSSSVCSHGDDAQHFYKSPFMHNCCRPCFYMFVKNVVNSTMMEKVGSTGPSRCI